MKKLKIFYLFIIILMILSIVFNLLDHQKIFSQFPWALLFMAVVPVFKVVNLPKSLILVIVFVVTLVGQRFGDYGYTNWTSWILYAVVSAIFSALAWFIVKDVQEDKSHQ